LSQGTSIEAIKKGRTMTAVRMRADPELFTSDFFSVVFAN
jgi:hypothetical protein